VKARKRKRLAVTVALAGFFSTWRGLQPKEDESKNTGSDERSITLSDGGLTARNGWGRCE